MAGIESLLMKVQLRWYGHLIRMENYRLPKAVFYAEFQQGKRNKIKYKRICVTKMSPRDSCLTAAYLWNFGRGCCWIGPSGAGGPKSELANLSNSV